jgi:hypothetical protein
MEEFLGGLGVAILTGMGWLAYRHPAGFRLIGTSVIMLASLGLLLLTAYDIGAQRLFGAVAEFIADEHVGDARRAAEAVKPNMLLCLGVYFALAIYVAFLGALPHILGQRAAEPK